MYAGPVSEGLIGVIIGGVLVTVSSVVVALIQADRAAALDQQKRLDDRRIGSDAFQRDTLLDLQERLAEWMRTLGQIHIADSRTLKEKGKLFQLPEGVSDANFDTGRRLMYLTDRVRDDDLRRALTDLRANAARGEAWRAVDHENMTIETLERDFVALVVEGDAVQMRLGEILRSYL